MVRIEVPDFLHRFLGIRWLKYFVAVTTDRHFYDRSTFGINFLNEVSVFTCLGLGGS